MKIDWLNSFCFDYEMPWKPSIDYDVLKLNNNFVDDCWSQWPLEFKFQTLIVLINFNGLLIHFFEWTIRSVSSANFPLNLIKWWLWFCIILATINIHVNITYSKKKCANWSKNSWHVSYICHYHLDFKSLSN